MTAYMQGFDDYRHYIIRFSLETTIMILDSYEAIINSYVNKGMPVDEVWERAYIQGARDAIHSA